MTDRFDAVLFDFGHTLFDTLPPGAHCDEFGRANGLAVHEGDFADAWTALRARARTPEELAKQRDLSAEAHRTCWMDLLTPLDELAPGLAAYVYGAETSPLGWRPYPEAVGVLERLRAAGVRIGVVSDTGWDIRSAFDAHGLRALVDHFVLSCEHGAVKPAPELFLAAAHALGAEPVRCLMVGDTELTDGGATAVGMTFLHIHRGEPADNLLRVLPLVGLD